MPDMVLLTDAELDLVAGGVDIFPQTNTSSPNIHGVVHQLRHRFGEPLALAV